MASYASSSSISHQVKADVDPLEREKQEIERRRQRFEDRKQRILHAKTRIIGIDVEALNEQVAEKQEKERLEIQRNLHFDDAILGHARTISLNEEQRRKDERRKAEELNFFRRQQIAEKRARDSIQQSQYPNMHYSHSNNNSNFLSFTGEDNNFDTRTRQQQEQQCTWLNNQVQERSVFEEKERMQEMDYAAYQDTMMRLQADNDREREYKKKLHDKNIAAFNQQLAADKQLSFKREKQLNERMDNREIQASLSSHLLNESVNSNNNNNNGMTDDRSIPYHFKGFTTEKRQQILDQQQKQQEELRNRRAQEASEEADFALQCESIRRSMIRADRDRARNEAAKMQALKDERLLQAKQKNLRTQYLNNVVYTNPVTDEYFSQFGTSCR